MSVDLRRSQDINNALTAVLNFMEMEEERYFVSTADLFNDLFQAYALKIDSVNTPVTIETSYVGLHLGDYEESDFHRLVKSFSNNERLHAFYTLKIINDAKEIVRKRPNINDCTVAKSTDSVIIVGDLHGNFRDLKHLIERYGVPGVGYQFVFNGDLVDRGRQQIEVLLIVLYALILNPTRVFINRGNHEDISMNTHSKFSPNFFTDCHEKYGIYRNVVFAAAEDLFTHLPFATIVNDDDDFRFFVVHGGISDSVDLDVVMNNVRRAACKKITHNAKDQEVNGIEHIRTLLWSDPIRTVKSSHKQPNATKGCFFNKKRNIGHYFGYDVTKEFCEKNNFKFILRSHEVRENGFELDHDKCFTVFSASFYQSHKNYAAVVLFTFESKSLEPHRFKTLDDDEHSELHESNIELIRNFKRLLASSEYNFLELFKSHDKMNTGSLDYDTWANIICEKIEGIDKAYLIDLKDYLCVCDDATSSVKYETMFTNVKSVVGEEYIDLLEHLFRIIDSNHDNKISLSEAKEALDFMNEKLSIPKEIYERYLNILMDMDQNSDHHVDFEEFKEAFLRDTDVHATKKVKTEEEEEK